jgi:hypothetical protein
MSLPWIASSCLLVGVVIAVLLRRRASGPLALAAGLVAIAGNLVSVVFC